MHRPSAEKEWQQPAGRVCPGLFDPDDVQAASYFALSASMVSFSMMSIVSTPHNAAVE